MDLNPLESTGNVSMQEFRQLFETRLGGNFARAQEVFTFYGEMFSFKVANVIHLGLQKGNVLAILEALEKWRDVVRKAPDPITAGVDTFEFFNIAYVEFFMTPTDTIQGIGFEEVKHQGPGRLFTLKPRIWTPDQH